MDQLYNNDSPAFTTWAIENGLLEEPFVVIDVGVQGGPIRVGNISRTRFASMGSMRSPKSSKS